MIGLDSNGAKALTAEQCREIAKSGFLQVSVPIDTASADYQFDIAALAKWGEEHTLDLWADLASPRYSLDHPFVAAHPSAFDIVYQQASQAIDPRAMMGGRAGEAILRSRDDIPQPIAAHLEQVVDGLIRSGAKGLVFRDPAFAGHWLSICRRLENVVKISPTAPAGSPQPDFLLVSDRVARPASLPVIVDMECIDDRPGQMELRTQAQLRRAVVSGNGVIAFAPIRALIQNSDDPTAADGIRATLALFDSEPILGTPPHIQILTGHGAPVEIAIRSDGDSRRAGRALFVISNPSETAPVEIRGPVWTSATAVFAPFPSLNGNRDIPAALEPGEVRIVSALRRPALPSPGTPADAHIAASAGRIVIGGVSPSVDEGRYAVKTTAGEAMAIEADVFADGHEHLAAELVVHVNGEKTPRRVPMTALPNDRWQSSLALTGVGRHAFSIDAWLDVWGGYTRDLEKKREAGLDLALEVREGCLLVRAAQQRSKGQLARRLARHVEAVEAGKPEEAVSELLSPALAEAMAAADDRPFLATSFVQPLDVERTEARFASWYELFPRSLTPDASRPGMLRDVIARLPAIRDMGFDVLYFPPIHPIGVRNRKGRNNTTTAQPAEPGSPYAIGSDAGGHDAIHPELGTLADFQALLEAASGHGLELALDFAIQCSPDHPWLKQHPEWFAWRPDGSIKYAENPPKKYQDIVNVDFYAAGAVPDLWKALRDVVVFWVEQGVKTFRVDNPHTKPLPFWEWMIGDVRAKHPEVIFLSEAFTRPKPMYHLAKVGFSQSYTYFTWRHSKAELTEYLTELNVTGVKDFFRPHFFVNTPDINPFFLQTSGRAGFLIRAALATTLSGLWGMYSGFELCESEALPGKEEYLDSEKFEVRPRDWTQPGNIIAEISQLNAIRKSEPALQSHLGLRFHNAFNDQILYFAKALPGDDAKILVAISLDPHRPQATSFEVPLWEWGLPDHGEVDVVDLLTGHQFVWHGKMQDVRLTPEAPYAIWNIRPRGTFR